MQTYVTGAPIDPEPLLIEPEFEITYGTDRTVMAELTYVQLSQSSVAPNVRLSRDQAIIIWGTKEVEDWEEAAIDAFDLNEALANEAADRADERYEQWRDDQMEAGR